MSRSDNLKRRKMKSWRNIKWIKNYRVSSSGEVKYNGKILEQQKNLEGFKTVTIDHVQYSTSRLVAKAFVKNKNPNQFNLVRHKNKIKDDDHDYNLEWYGPTYRGIKSGDNKVRVKSSYPIVGIDMSTFQVVIFACVDNSKMYGLSPTNIRHVINHPELTSGGFKWFKYNDIKDHIDVFKLYYQSPRLKIKSHNYSRTRPKKVIGTNLKTHKSHIYNTINKAARELNLDPGSVCNCAKGLLRKTHGWSFDYYEDQ